ncbi:MAG: hypothetical protein QG608_436 [Actinomycetota bacterium]|nr:hypothetical protein [Actinomycetota bacterium]
MIERIVPTVVKAAEEFGEPDPRAEEQLFPEEHRIVARAVDKRRREFASVRSCARAALSDLGVGYVPLLSGPRGEPLWPDGVVGSMTHCQGYRGAVVARAAELPGAAPVLGMDAEPDEPLPRGILERIALPAERERIEELRAAEGRGETPCGPGPHWDRLLFCAKEAVYKAWYPLTERWLGFDEADIRMDLSGTLSVRLLVTGPTVRAGTVAGFSGRWTAGRGLVLAAVTGAEL